MKLIYRQLIIAMVFSTTLVCSVSLFAQSAEELAKAAQNPVADLISLPFQNNTNFNFGPEEDTQNVLNIQPVIPFGINEDWNLITRTIIPVISQPGVAPGQNRKNGLGDIQFTAFLSPKEVGASGWIWGAGAVAQFDSASDDRLGAGAFGLGPSAVMLKSFGPWVVGGLVNNIWSLSADRDDVNLFLFQPFINYNFPDKPGRYLTFAPIITANWEAKNGNTWTVPVGLGIGQITRFGKQPVNMQASAYYNVKKPDFGADWQLRLQLQLMFPK
jgi:hypothetical protein